MDTPCIKRLNARKKDRKIKRYHHNEAKEPSKLMTLIAQEVTY